MKFRLPKKLMAAVLAAMVTFSSYAGMYQPGGSIYVGYDDEEVQVTASTPGINAPIGDDNIVVYAPITKDGAGNAVISESLTMTAPIYVREGILTVRGDVKHYAGSSKN